MAETHFERRSRTTQVFFGLLLVGATALTLLAVWIPLMAPVATTQAVEGQVAQQDYRAPRTISFESQFLTEQRQEAAERAVSPVYTPPNPTVARQQLEQLHTTLAYIASIRADQYASQQQKLEDLAALEAIHLDQQTALELLQLSEPRWQIVQQEAVAVLERVMRTSIREDRLEESHKSVPSLVSLSLPESQAELVAELASAFVTPNSLYSEELTLEARRKAREAVSAVIRSYVVGQTVVQRGQVISSGELEALRQMGLAQPVQKWQDFASPAILVLLLATFVVAYLRRVRTPKLGGRSLLIIAALFLAFLFGGRLMLPGHTVIPYAYPVAAYSLTIVALFSAELALVTTLPLAILVAYGLPNALELTLYYILGALMGVLVLGRARRMISFLWAGVAIAFTSAVIVLVYRLPLPSTDLVGITTLLGMAFFNGLASAGISVLLQFILAQFLGIVTPLHLMDLTRPDHPLLQLILHNAAGTYQHSLQVANLAEQAAERIGADPLLTRVGALYHDVGKTVNPVFFIENQVPGFLNPHDDLDPEESVEIILRHVKEGLEIARKNRLPRRIHDFIAEHHGTMIARYQYVRAVTLAGGDESQVMAERFTYPGPRPRSRETAVLMLADGCEARVRAERPKDESELNNLVKGVIDNRLALGQLSDTPLTLQELEIILQSFTATLRGIYHPRVKYPRLEATVASSGEVPTVPVTFPFTAPQPSDAQVGSPGEPESSIP